LSFNNNIISLRLIPKRYWKP